MNEVNDGYAGGPQIVRNTTNKYGGVPGSVNTAYYIRSITGADVTAFEWNALFVMDNYAKAGDNCASYSQTNKYNTGSSFGSVSEVCMETNLSGAAVAHEFDVWAVGPDNGLRFGADICVGDGAYIRGKGRSNVAEATLALRFGTTMSTTWARWVYGIVGSAFTQCGLLLDSIATRAIQLKGKYVVGLDLSTAECQSAIRLAPGQRMTFEPTDQISWSWLDGRLRVQNGGTNVIEIDTTTGDIYKHGVKVI